MVLVIAVGTKDINSATHAARVAVISVFGKRKKTGARQIVIGNNRGRLVALTPVIKAADRIESITALEWPLQSARDANISDVRR